MKQYYFEITALHQVNRTGHYLPEGILFSCKAWADKSSVDRYAFGQQLFDFWTSSNMMGAEQEEWLYQWRITEL